MRFKRRDAVSKSLAESVFFPQPLQIRAAQNQRRLPVCRGNLTVEQRCRQAVWQFAAGAWGEGHGEHVVGRGKLVGLIAVGDEGEVTGVHVGVADQGAEGMQQAGGFVGLAADVAFGGKSGCDAGPATLAESDKFCIHGAERDQAAPAVRADAVETFDFKKALLAVVDDAGADRADAIFAE